MTTLVIRWLACFVLHVLVWLFRQPLAVLAVTFFSTADRRHLASWLWWFETIDNDLSGDSGWREQHLIGTDPLSWLNRTRWLFRNGGNALNYFPLGVPALPPMSGVYDTRRLFTVRYNIERMAYDALMIRKFLRFGSSKYLEIWLGWALYGPQHGRCKFVCTIRPRTRAEN